MKLHEKRSVEEKGKNKHKRTRGIVVMMFFFQSDDFKTVSQVNQDDIACLEQLQAHCCDMEVPQWINFNRKHTQHYSAKYCCTIMNPHGNQKSSHGRNTLLKHTQVSDK